MVVRVEGGRHPRGRVAGRFAAATLCLAVLVPAVALAGWKAPRTLSEAGEGGQNPAVATAPDGTTIVAWMRFDGTQPPNTCCERIQAVIRRPGGKFGKVKTLSAAGEDAGSPQVAIGADGTAAVIWTRFDGTAPPFTCCRRAQVRVFRPGGGWGPVQTLSAGGEDAMDVAVGVGRNGQAVAIWTREEGAQSDRRLQARFRGPGGGAGKNFGGLQTLSPPDESAYAPHLGVAPDGSATLVWQRYDGNHDRTVVNVRPAGGKFGKRRNLSRPNDEADYHTVVVGPDGTALAAWLVETGGIEYELEVSRRRPGGRFGGIVKLSSAAQSGDPAVALDADGQATVVWQQLVPGEDRIVVRTAKHGTDFGARKFLSPAALQVQNPVVDASPDGTTIAAWIHYDDSEPFCCGLAQARVRRAGKARFRAQRTLSLDGQNAGDLVVAARNGGGGAAVWDRFDGSDARVQTATYKP